MNSLKICFTALFLSMAILMVAQPGLQTNFTFSNPTCNNLDGTASVAPSGGTAPYSIEWKKGIAGITFSTNTSVTGLDPGYYTVTVFDANNLSKVDTVTLSNSFKAMAYSSAAANCPANDGSATVMIIAGGTAPFTYHWSNGATSNVASSLSGNSVLQVEVEDANGCKAYMYDNASNQYPTTIGTVTIGMNTSIASTYSTTSEVCPMNNGTATVTPTGSNGPYTYYWNSVPVQTTPTATGLKSGSYTVKITDAYGCVETKYAYVGYDAGTLMGTASVTHDYCSQNTGTASLNISGGVAPYTVLWENNATTTSRTGLSCGHYRATVTDANSCVITVSAFITNNSPVSTSITKINSGCDNISGSASVVASGGTAPYTYAWSTGDTGTSISNLSNGYYTVEVTDANGCQRGAWTHIDVNSNCFAFISGTYYQDDNGNCLQDVGEYPIQNQGISMRTTSNNNYLYQPFASTDATGFYSLRYVLADTYNVSTYDTKRTAACPSGGIHSITIPTAQVNYPNKDFAMHPTTLEEDVALLHYTLVTPPRPGFDYSYVVFLKNSGTIPSNGYIEVRHEALESFVSSSPAANLYTPATKTLRFNYSNLQLGEIRSFFITYHVPATTVLGSTFSHNVTATISGTDPTPWNNSQTVDLTVVGSFDPNDLRVSPENILETTADTLLEYSIRFQNTGTYPASLVVIRDTLDANLDIETITDIRASHTFCTRALNKGVFEVGFENINLPDSTHNEKGSHGYVRFKINRKKNLPIGTEIKNKVEIYFDFNEPVVTNTTTNTISLTSGTIPSTPHSFGVVYPNPAKDYALFKFEKEVLNLLLMNASGIPVMNKSISNETEIRLELSYPKGMYYYKATGSDGNSFAGKLLIE